MKDKIYPSVLVLVVFLLSMYIVGQRFDKLETEMLVSLTESRELLEEINAPIKMNQDLVEKNLWQVLEIIKKIENDIKTDHD